MSQHSERLQAAERAVIDAAVATREAGLRAVAEMTAAHNAGQDRTDAWKREMPLRDRLRRADAAAVDALLTLRAQTCPECGIVAKKLLSQRKHVCGCGYSTHRDHAAARIILSRGQAGMQPGDRNAGVVVPHGLRSRLL